jgi:hypothetical protein
VPQPSVPPETGKELVARIDGTKSMLTTPIGPTGQSVLKAFAPNDTTTVLPVLPVRRSVFVMVTEPVDEVVGF